MPAWMDGASYTVRGALAEDAIVQGLSAGERPLFACVAALEALHPKAPRGLEIRFTVDLDGRPTDIGAAADQTVPGWYADCARDALTLTGYPPAKAPTAVSWRLNLGVGATNADETSPSPERRPGDLSPGALGLTDESTVLGGLDRSLIDAVVRRNTNAIQYCYGRELAKNPSLQGKVVVKFVIAKDGTVSTATTKSTTLNQPVIEGCINKVFMAMEFPEPRGGGIVIVSYPFTFAPG